MKRQGFSLLEVVIALAIMGMVMVAVMQTLDGTRLAVDTIHNIMETENTGPRIMAQIRQDLDAIAVNDVKDGRVMKGENQTLLGAQADRLDLITTRRGSLPMDLAGRSNEVIFAPINEVGYRMRQNPRSRDFLELYRREDPMVDDEPFRDGSYTLLYDRVVSLDIRYLDHPDVTPNWVDDWDSEMRDGLPFAMDIFLEIEVQPRRSLESLGILGANRSRLEFAEVFHMPERKRWTFRNRLRPGLTMENPGQPGEGTNPTGTDGATDGTNGVVPDGANFDGDLGTDR